MRKLHDIEFYSASFFVGALFPFVEEDTLYLLTVQHLDKYKSGKINTKLPGGTGDQEYTAKDNYFARLEEVLDALSFDRRAKLLVLNQEYSRRALFEDHPHSNGIKWILKALVLNVLEATGYYPADLDPRVVDIVERSEEHYQYFLEIKELWGPDGEPITIPDTESEFKPLDTDIVVPREKMPILEFEDLLIGSHCRPVEFYLEYLREVARKNQQQTEE